MKLVIAKSARTTLKSVPPKLAAALLNALVQIAEDPFGDHPNAKRLKGVPMNSACGMAIGGRCTGWIGRPDK